MKKILVTGAGGFVGASLCRALSLSGYPTTGVVRSIKQRVPGVDYLEVDLLQEDSFSQAFPLVDCVVHLAGRAHMLNEQAKDPLEAFRCVNRDATLKLAEKALNANVRRFVFVSSIGVNGNQSQRCAFDELSIVQPHADYALSKFEAEEGLKLLVKGTKMELVIIRPPLIYGADAPGNFSRLLRLVASGVPLPFGSIHNRRSLISLENMVGVLIRCIEHPGAAGQLFLVADGQDVSTAQMVRHLATGMGKRTLLLPVPEVAIKYGLAAMGKSSLYSQLCGSLQIDATKARRVLDWDFKTETLVELEKVGRAYAVSHSM